MDRSILVRDAAEDDMAAVLEIYSHHVLHGLASFEEQPPALSEMRLRRVKVLDQGLPYLVAQGRDGIVGYAYASEYRARPAYRYTVEDSVYVADGMGGRGIGRALLSAVITRCEIGPWRQMIAVIGDSGNIASITLHERQGFQPAGLLHAVGYKFGRWIDSVLMQRPLGHGSRSQPPSRQ